MGSVKRVFSCDDGDKKGFLGVRMSNSVYESGDCKGCIDWVGDIEFEYSSRIYRIIAKNASLLFIV